jgi:hypothetical protein
MTFGEQKCSRLRQKCSKIEGNIFDMWKERSGEKDQASTDLIKITFFFILYMFQNLFIFFILSSKTGSKRNFRVGFGFELSRF